MTTEPVPHIGLSTAPTVPTDAAEKIRQALVNTHTTENDKKMLAALKVEKFEAASNETYDAYSDLLKDVYGYDIAKQ